MDQEPRKSGYLDRMILFGTESLRRALRENCVHFQSERPHQGLDNGLTDPSILAHILDHLALPSRRSPTTTPRAPPEQAALKP